MGNIASETQSNAPCDDIGNRKRFSERWAGYAYGSFYPSFKNSSIWEGLNEFFDPIANNSQNELVADEGEGMASLVLGKITLNARGCLRFQQARINAVAHFGVAGGKLVAKPRDNRLHSNDPRAVNIFHTHGSRLPFSFVNQKQRVAKMRGIFSDFFKRHIQRDVAVAVVGVVHLCSDGEIRVSEGLGDYNAIAGIALAELKKDMDQNMCVRGHSRLKFNQFRHLWAKLFHNKNTPKSHFKSSSRTANIHEVMLSHAKDALDKNSGDPPCKGA